MNLTVIGIKRAVVGDPVYADFWLEFIHLDSHISWEVPMNKDEASKLKRYLPKSVQKTIPEIKDFWEKNQKE